MLLLGGNDDELPEGWGNAFDNKTSKGEKSKDSDVDMEVTFMPGLSQTKNPEDENTLEIYQRKMKEKRKKKKEEARQRGEVDDDGVLAKTTKSSFDDEFFGVGSDNPRNPTESSKAELALLTASDNPHGEPAHFDMKAVLKAEKQGKNKKSRHKSKKRDRENDVEDGPGETQDDFVIDVKDDRFAASFYFSTACGICTLTTDTSLVPFRFKKTKSMAALLNERSKRQKHNARSDHPAQSQCPTQQNDRSLQSLVESVKRKSTAVDHSGLGKRHKLGKS
ncbi:hypothetical protein J3R83DRAFT_4515 [Lanmaoa asiatica]|nr:hypothetical protein J3R83DRAFT_4515 [Lanmaoa asiatica]